MSGCECEIITTDSCTDSNHSTTLHHFLFDGARKGLVSVCLNIQSNKKSVMHGLFKDTLTNLDHCSSWQHVSSTVTSGKQDPLHHWTINDPLWHSCSKHWPISGEEKQLTKKLTVLCPGTILTLGFSSIYCTFSFVFKVVKQKKKNIVRSGVQ